MQQLQREGLGVARRVTKANRSSDNGEVLTTMEKPPLSIVTTSTPCLPYIAMRICTQLIHLELHQPDRVTPAGAPSDDSCGLINFAKQRRLADIVERFLQHQRVPYNFVPQPKIQQALVASLERFNLDDREFEARMYALSESYEPREPSSESPQSTSEAVILIFLLLVC